MYVILSSAGAIRRGVTFDDIEDFLVQEGFVDAGTKLIPILDLSSHIGRKVTGDEDEVHGGVDRAQTFGQLESIHVGEDYVQEREVEAVMFHQIEGCLGGQSFLATLSFGGQNMLQSPANIRLIIHDKEFTIHGVGAFRQSVGNDVQLHGEGAALSRHALHRNGAGVSFDHAIAKRKAQSCPGFFGGT